MTQMNAFLQKPPFYMQEDLTPPPPPVYHLHHSILQLAHISYRQAYERPMLRVLLSFDSNARNSCLAAARASKINCIFFRACSRIAILLVKDCELANHEHSCPDR